MRLEVTHFQDTSPFVVEVFTNEAPVAVMRCGFRTKEARAIEYLGGKAILDLAFRHKAKEALLIRTPVAFFFLISLEHLVGWSQQWLVHILDVSDSPKKKGEIVGLSDVNDFERRGTSFSNISSWVLSVCSRRRLGPVPVLM
jgi:hypothetical protein